MKIKINNEVSQNVQDIELGSISLANIISLIRPVGSLYWSANNINPSTIYPGTTWEAVKDKFIVAAGTTYKAGTSYGQTTHTHTSAAHTHTVASHTHTTGNHTLTVAEMPSHTHDWKFSDVAARGTDIGANSDGHTRATTATGGGQAHNHGNTGGTSLTTNSTTPGNTGSASNIPPSIAMYCWIRTA